MSAGSGSIPSPVYGDFVDLAGRRFYRITGYDQIPPFFMTLVGASDLWLFISSTGGMTAGRGDPSRAIFPYYTDDKVTESAGRTGGLCLLRMTDGDGRPTVWEPFTADPPYAPDMERALYKDDLGTTLVFEESRRDLGLRVRVEWTTSRRLGLVRTTRLESVSSRPSEVDVLDGLVNVLPAGTDPDVQNRLSNLLDAYKRTELDPETGLAMLWLSSGLTDLAEPSESLRANVVWQVGLPAPTTLLSTRQLRAFRAGAAIHGESDVRGGRGAYLLHARVTLGAGEFLGWRIVADADLDAARVVDLREQLRHPRAISVDLEADITATRTDLAGILAAADGFQRTGEPAATVHHLANTVFNVMRGGVPASGYAVHADDFRAFLRVRNPLLAARQGVFLDELPGRFDKAVLVRLAESSGDPDLIRLANEYIPLTFSRRHGDPSRPWNRFSLPSPREDGRPAIGYQGNWRDIFQNWEALSWSFPEFVESMVAVFLNATTVDGYNPYRVSLEGIDWEIPEPGDPWANIGYWNDHQIVYLLRLLETSRRFHPGRLEAWLTRPVFAYGDVPYRIADYPSIVADPFSTITFDAARAAAVAERCATEGSDGRLVHDDAGTLVRATLAEKLLLLALAKLVNFVPDGGIWMNTQRPEWNDANNALVGRGLSVVTLAQLRRFLAFLRTLLTVDVDLSEELAALLSDVANVLAAHAPDLASGFVPVSRRSAMDGLGAAGSRYRQAAYRGLTGARVTLPAGRVREFLDSALRHVDAGIRANRRDDGLYHSYNLLLLDEGEARIGRLPEMLEGQVAVLSCGLLGADEALALTRALRRSHLYRTDQHTYLLYPDKDLPGFLSRNRFDEEAAAGCPLVRGLADAGDRQLVVRDSLGGYHFAASIRNGRDVDLALDRLAGDPVWATAVARDRESMHRLFEEVFHHSEFTGRSGTFFAYEGLGSVYWHMVAKLLLAVQEQAEDALVHGASVDVLRGLRNAYEDVRTGLGYCKSPDVYGAFPTDPYSHTPADAGARQPGMTGQVKEELLARWAELGLRVQDGRIAFRPFLLRASEWTGEPGEFRYVDVHGTSRTLAMPHGSLAFTYCQVPVLLHRGDRLEARVRFSDGSEVVKTGADLGGDVSRTIFERSGAVRSVTVSVPPVDLALESSP